MIYLLHRLRRDRPPQRSALPQFAARPARIDSAIRKLFDVLNWTDRRYDVVLLSDHGMTPRQAVSEAFETDFEVWVNEWWRRGPGDAQVPGRPATGGAPDAPRAARRPTSWRSRIAGTVTRTARGGCAPGGGSAPGRWARGAPGRSSSASDLGGGTGRHHVMNHGHQLRPLSPGTGRRPAARPGRWKRSAPASPRRWWTIRRSIW